MNKRPEVEYQLFERLREYLATCNEDQFLKICEIAFGEDDEDIKNYKERA